MIEVDHDKTAHIAPSSVYCASIMPGVRSHPCRARLGEFRRNYYDDDRRRIVGLQGRADDVWTGRLHVNRGRTSESQRIQLLLYYWVVYEGQRKNECFQLIDGKPSLHTACSTIFTLRAKHSGAVYCNRSCLFVGLWLCLFVCGSVTRITRNCVHRSSPNWVCRQRWSASPAD